MKILKTFLVILSLVLLTACGSGQSVQTSETVSETVSATESTAVTAASQTTATETETSSSETVPADNDIAFDDELASALADIIEQHNGGRFFMYDFNRDGCPEIAFYGYDMITAFFDIYDFSGGEAVSMGAVTLGECSLNADNRCLADRFIDDGCLEFYYSKEADEYLYVSLLRYADGSGGEALTFVQMMLRMPVSGDIDFGSGVTDEEYTYIGKSEEEWYAARDRAWESLSGYEVIEHINLQTVKLYTVYDPSPYDPSSKELAATVLKEYYAETVTAAENAEQEYVQVSPDNEFIDFDFIEDYRGTDDIGGLADKALEYLKTTDFYADSMKNIAEFSDEEFSSYIKDGKIVPKFSTAYPADYDGDGRMETFIAVNMPVHYGYSGNTTASFYIYSDSGENMTLLDIYGSADAKVTFLNYGRDKQIAFGGGFSPYGSITYLYGVRDGDPVLLYSEQAGLEKRACFLRSHGFQAAEDFMYFDTTAREYRHIAAEKVSHDKLKSLDASGSLNSVFEEHGDQFSAWLVGGKYYCIKVMFEFADVYAYDNGTFTLIKDPVVGLDIPVGSTHLVKDIDIDKAVAEMKPPAEPYVTVSPDNEFIDFDLITDYRSTDDIGDLADKAVEYIKTTDFYAESMKNIAEFSDEEFSSYIKDGKIVPKFNIAYPNDYDGDGKTETFIVVDMPYYLDDFRPVIRNILIFADSGGAMDTVGDYSYFKQERYTVLLDYGRCRQIVFGGDGLYGADMHTDLFGVKDGKAVKHHSIRGSFKKEKCFLSADNYYGGNGFMYFDTAANEYRPIVGVPLSIDEMKETDRESFFAEYYEKFEKEGFVYFERIGGNYYRVYRDKLSPASVYRFENGKFTKIKDSGIGIAWKVCGSNAVVDIDIDKAVAEMRPVKK